MVKIILIPIFLIHLLNCSVFEKNDSKNKDRNSVLALLALSRNTSSALGEEYAGGEATSFNTTSSAFFIQAPNVTDASKKQAFTRGHNEFLRVWVAPGSPGAVGLGPTFNATSCNGCHSQDGRGAPAAGTVQTSMLFRLGTSTTSTTTNYGDQFNPSSIGSVPNEGTISTSYVEQAGTYTDGESYSLRVPTYTAALANYGTVTGLTLSPRIAQQNPGLGLLEAISEETLLSNADPNDTNGDGISGKANYVTDTADGTTKIGRFGWKSNQPNINHQNQGAFLGDLGVTSPLFLNENCPGTQATTTNSANCGFAGNTGRGVGVAEVTANSVSSINTYMLTISAPGRRNWTDSTVVQGKNLMVSLGCTKCHIAEMKTGTLASTPEVSNQTIRPYTDLLLHDMGSALADGRPDSLATGNEWRTPPLWGVGLIKTINGHDNLLHDGRARGFAEAILWHGGEAETSKENFRALSKTNREALIKFLESL